MKFKSRSEYLKVTQTVTYMISTHYTDYSFTHNPAKSKSEIDVLVDPVAHTIQIMISIEVIIENF